MEQFKSREWSAKIEGANFRYLDFFLNIIYR